MSQDFSLPDSILAVIPNDPYDQLYLARKITSLAIASRVTKLETEAETLRLKLNERDRLIEELEGMVTSLQSARENSDLRLQTTREDNMKLLKERDSLALTVKKLSRDLAKLETFKRQLMQSLNSESSPTETVDIGTYDQSVPKAYDTHQDSLKGYTKPISYIGSTDGANTNDVSKPNVQKLAVAPYITPRLTPTGTPKVKSTAVSPRRYSTAKSPQRTSGVTSPTNRYDGQGSLSSWYPSSQQSSAANSPPRGGHSLPGRTPRVDGKEFFRQARSRLSLEQFSEFLTIKDLNAQKQSREETLRIAEKIFGTENNYLYLSFQVWLRQRSCSFM